MVVKTTSRFKIVVGEATILKNGYVEIRIKEDDSRTGMPDKNPSEESEIISVSKLGIGEDALSDMSGETEGLDETICPESAAAFDATLSPTGILSPLDQATNLFTDTDIATADRDFSVDGNDDTLDASASPVGLSASRMLQPKIPSQIGAYEILSILGRGGMGVVYKARHKRLDREVALKMVLAGSHASSEQHQRFIIEAKAVAHLQHPNIVQIFEVGEENGLPFFSLEFVDGEGLDNQIRKRPLDPVQAAKLTETLARAMQFAHDHHIIHRDLKPANVLMSRVGVPKIADFGLAKRLEDADDSGSTRTGTIMGTPSYMSPEQASGDVRGIGPATDQYSLSAMLYEFMTGRPPFLSAKPVETIMQVLRTEPVAPRQLQPKLPIDLETICLKALQKDPAKRYANCKDFADDLARFVKGEPIAARPVSQLERGWRWCKRNPLVATLSAMAATGLVAVAIISSVSSWMVLERNSQLKSVNSSLSQANSSLDVKIEELDSTNQELKKTNVQLSDSISESNRRSKRLEDYIKNVFQEVKKIDIAENPRMKDYRNGVLVKTIPIIDEIVKELPEGQGIPAKMSALSDLAQSYRELGQSKEAEARVVDLVALARQRVLDKQGSDASRNNLSIMLRQLSEIRQEMSRDVTASQAALREAIEVAEEMVDSSKAASDGQGVMIKYKRQMVLAEAVFGLGVSHYRQGNGKAAIKHLERALSLYQTVYDSVADGSAFQNPPPNSQPITEDEKKRTFASLRVMLSKAKLAMAGVYHRIGEPTKAESLFKTAFDAAEKNLASDPTSTVKMRELVGMLGLQGEFLAQTGRFQEVRLPMRYAIVIENAGPNFSAYVPDLPGCVATGATVEEAECEIREAIEFHLEGLREDGSPIPPPSSAVRYVDIAA